MKVQSGSLSTIAPIDSMSEADSCSCCDSWPIIVSIESAGIFIRISAWALATRRPLSSAALRPNLYESWMVTPE